MLSPLRFILHLHALAFVGLLLAGCGGGKPNPASSNISYGPDDQFANRILDRSERREVIATLQSAVVGPTDDPARPARFGVRWEDVRSAAVAAGAKFELAVLSVEADPDDSSKTVELVSIREVPVSLLVRRAPAPEIYTATVTAGLFEEHAELAADFLDAFNVSMRTFGAKPGWTGLKNE